MINNIKNTLYNKDIKGFTFKINILKNFKIFYFIAVFLSVISFFSIFFLGFNKSVDFAGGFIMNISCKNTNQDGLDTSKCLEETKSILSKYHKNPSEFKTLDNYIVVQFNSQDISTINDVDDLKSFISSSEKLDIVKSDFINKKFGSQIIKNGILAIILTLVGIFIYLFIRFSFAFAISATITLLHDTIVLLGFISIARIEMNLSIVAAILTVVGYSVNDSVIIFDRIRQNLALYKSKLSLYEIVCGSVMQTLSRTVITSLTTLFSIIAIILFAGSPVVSFGYTVLFGIILGTYSSIFLSAPLLFWLQKFDKNLQH